jgi:hypothetical protein
MSPREQLKLRIAMVLCALCLAIVLQQVRAQVPPVHWSEGTPTGVEACDDLAGQQLWGEAEYCLSRYRAVAAGLLVDGASPEFAEVLPLLALLGVGGLGFAIGSAVYPR